MTIRTSMIITLLFLLVACDEKQLTLTESRTKLLVNTIWENAETIRESGNSYVITTPIYFQTDKNVLIGHKPYEWKLIDDGNSIEITQSSIPGWRIVWSIMSLTESKLEIIEYDSNGQFIVELRLSGRKI